MIHPVRALLLGRPWTLQPESLQPPCLSSGFKRPLHGAIITSLETTVKRGKFKKCPATWKHTLVPIRCLEWKSSGSTRAHRTCSAARARPGCPSPWCQQEQMLAVARLQMPAVSLTLLGTVGRNSLSRHCEVSPGGPNSPQPLQEPSLHRDNKEGNHSEQGRAGQDSNNKGLATKPGHLPPSTWRHADENLVSRRHA